MKVKIAEGIKEDTKREYLVRTFSRTKRKDYENYILNAIGHKLDRSDIQPVTQQFIKRSDGRYALVDLYFSQLSIGVECDEAHHIEISKEDQHRTLTMEEILSAYDETEDFQLLRIKAYESIDEAMVMGLEMTVSDLLSRDITPTSATIEAINDLENTGNSFVKN